MLPETSPVARAPLLDRPAWVIGVGAALLATIFAWRGITDPWVAGFAIATFSAVVLIALHTAPLLLLWVVPLSMSVFLYSPVLHYEVLVVVLAISIVIARREGVARRTAHWDPVERAFLFFVVSTFLSVLVAANLWRFGGTWKIHLIGLLGFEVARRGARRYGREAMLWGPAIFMLITALMLMTRASTSGIPGFRSIQERSFLSELPWGQSNYVAAVTVLCTPGMLLLTRLSPTRSVRQVLAYGILAVSLGAMLVTSSRGGFVLSTAYLLSQSVRLRRSSLPALGMLLVGAATLILSPFGQATLERFTNWQSTHSILFRFAMWAATWQRGMTHLPLGVGTGQGIIQQDLLAWMDPHNYLLTLFSESGPLAVIAWVGLMVVVVRSTGGVRARLGEDATRVLHATVALGFINSMFEPTFTGNLYFLLFWWLIGTLESGALRPGIDQSVAPLRTDA